MSTPDSSSAAVIYVTAAEYAALPPSDDWTGPVYRTDEDLPEQRPYTREEIAELSRSPQWREAAADAAEDAREVLRSWEQDAYEDPHEAAQLRACRLDDDSDCL